MKSIIKVQNTLDSIAKLLNMICVAAFALICLLQVVLRSFHTSIMWAEEASRYLLYVTVFVGTVLCTRENGHFSIDLLQSILPEKARVIQKLIVHIAMFVFSCYFTASSFTLSKATGKLVSIVMKIPMGKLYWVMIICGAWMAIYILIMIVEDILAMIMTFKKREIVESGQ